MTKKKKTRKQQIPRWQKNLQTFYNPSGCEVEEELGELAFISMMERSNTKPTTSKKHGIIQI